MFCYQCEQTAGGKACTKVGVCGKQPDVAALQDLLVYALKGLSQVALEGRKVGVNDQDVGSFICKALFSTLTNVNFDAREDRGPREEDRRSEGRAEGEGSGAGGKGDVSTGPATFKPEGTIDGNGGPG